MRLINNLLTALWLIGAGALLAWTVAMLGHTLWFPRALPWELNPVNPEVVPWILASGALLVVAMVAVSKQR